MTMLTYWKIRPWLGLQHV